MAVHVGVPTEVRRPQHMTMADLALLIAGGLFIAFILLKLSPLFAGPRGAGAAEARAQIQMAKRRARDRSLDSAQRAKAWHEAAMAALEGLRRPGLAASYALRAERANPGDPEGVGVVSKVLRRGHRYRALERVLWRRLSNEPMDSASYRNAFQELLRLYEGPMNSPERSEALRRLRRE